eukprot:maker-scaffold18_size714446-snap-gene-1.15 protein:Tk08451 transcript:maker-scaffold18_size714446-snap-gene-1.15-mRNA-1 annotation:"sulfide:quinone mitochondrial precursor"
MIDKGHGRSDPSTREYSSTGEDPSTSEDPSTGEDPSTTKIPIEDGAHEETSPVTRVELVKPDKTEGVEGILQGKHSEMKFIDDDTDYKLVVVGGGAGGCSTAAKFASKLGAGQVAIIEPRDTHYYQPMWTLVGGGQKSLSQSGKPMKDVLPKKADWIKDKAMTFDPDNCKVTTQNGDVISYEYLVVAMGLQLNYDQVKGLPEAFETPGVGSNYDVRYVEKTWKAIQDFKEGNCVFTLPNTPVKCAGAPQKIMYLAERILRKQNRRDKANFIYHTSLPVIFGVEKYANALWKIVGERHIDVNLRSNLVEVNPDTREAFFQNLDKPDEAPTAVKYSLLHVTPPMSAPDVLRKATKIVDQAGFLDVDKETLQHVKYPNIFGIGDCTNVPTSKTAAAVAGEIGIMRKNLTAAMNGQPLKAKYDGYTSCPLVTGPGECILAEFDFQSPPQPLETFPVNQGKPRWTMYNMKAHIMPIVYWQMLNGYWEGPRIFRKLAHLGMSR